MASPTRFYHAIQFILQMWSSDQRLVTLAFLGFDHKNRFFEEWSWFKFNNLGTGTR